MVYGGLSGLLVHAQMPKGFKRHNCRCQGVAVFILSVGVKQFDEDANLDQPPLS